MTDYMSVLKMIEEGDISPEEGIKLLQGIGTMDENNFDSRLDTLDILEKIESGEISAITGIQLIGENNRESKDYTSSENNYMPGLKQDRPSISEEDIERWKRWWTFPLYIGLGIVIISTFWLNAAYQNSQFGFWFFCSLIPLIIGLLLISISWGTKSGPWIHIRVKGEKERVAFSIPAPIGITSWLLRNFGHYIPQLEKTSVDEILLALENTSRQNAPLYIQVDEGEKGEHVEIFIG